MDEKKTVETYIEVVGHEPRNLPEDHPDRWQWLYRGTPKDKEMLKAWLGGVLPDLDDGPVVIEGQESLL